MSGKKQDTLSTCFCWLTSYAVSHIFFNEISSRISNNFKDEFDKMKDELNGQMTRLRADCADQVCELEKQLDLSNENRMKSMFQMKEEVNFIFYLTIYLHNTIKLCALLRCL